VSAASARDVERRIGALVEMGRLDEALALAGEALARKPSVTLWCRLAQIQLVRREHDEALSVTNQAILAAPDSEWPLRLRAMTLARLGRQEEAAGAARLAVATRPDSAYAWTALAEILAYTGDTAGAYAAARRAFELAPADDDVLATALFVAVLAADWSLCERVAKAVLERQPDHAQALYALGRVAEANGDPERALQLHRRALALAPGSRNYLATIQDLLVDLGRYDESIQVSERVLEFAPDHARAWCGIAQASLSARRGANALAAAARAVDLAPEDDFALRLYAGALWALGREAEALAAARAAAELPGPSAVPARPWVDLARKLISAGRLDEAEDALTEARRLGPHLVLVHAEVARLALARLEPGRAADAAAAALRRDDTDAHAHCAAGYAGAARDDWRSARAAFDRARTARPRYCCARAGLLLARLELGEPGVDVAAGLEEVDESSAGCRCELIARIRAHP
jgi:tetratricopeptide (TPR) repeat protein